MRRLPAALMVVTVALLALTATLAGAQDPPPPTHTPTPTYTPTPDYTAAITLTSGQPGRVVYEISAGDYLLGVLAFVQTVILALILYTLQRNRLTDD